jgi:hypothetical protein
MQPMKIKDWFNKWNFESLKINVEFLEMELSFTDTDKIAAWEMYVELLTRITTQELEDKSGDEQTALNSVLNQKIRPFTAKWHKKSLNGAFENPKECKKFRKELKKLQVNLNNYTGMLSEIAGVENLTELEN